MKKILLSLSFATMASLTFLSCSKGDYSSGDLQTGYNPFANVNNTIKTAPVGTFSANVNGSPFKAAYSNAYFRNVVGTESWYMVGFKTGIAASDGFVLLTSKKEVGTYIIDNSGINTIIFKGTGSTSPVLAESGSIQITELTDSRVKGNFNMTAAGFEATDGIFDLPIIKYEDYVKK